MNFLMGISYVNNLDLLRSAINSIETYWPHTIVVDNSEQRDLRKEKDILNKVTVYEPPIPLTVPQKMNFLQEVALKRDCDVLMYMHDDAEAIKGTPEALLSVIEDLMKEGKRWGVVFTRAIGTPADYDYLCAFNMEAVKKVGDWDTTFTQYGCDTDFYWRIYAAGFDHIYTGLPIIHHGSSTRRKDLYISKVIDYSIHLYNTYYIAKWGGFWFDEKYKYPFDPTETIDKKPQQWKFP